MFMIDNIIPVSIALAQTTSFFVAGKLFKFVALSSGFNQGYRNRYDIIDHGHEKTTFMYIFHRSIFTEIREFTTIVL